MKRMTAVLGARFREFYRDKTGLSWNLLMPFMILTGFAFLFDDRPTDVLTVGVLGEIPAVIENVPGIKIEVIDEHNTGVVRVERHQLDLFVESSEPLRYWVNEYSSKGQLTEHLLQRLGTDQGADVIRESVSGESLRYVDWVLPGVLSMNLMFSCLWGIGWVIVRYRKNGVLRRLQATPLTPLEFLSAQVIARLVIVVVVTLIVYLGSALLIDFTMRGSHFALALVFLLGGASLTSVGLLVAARLKTEEVADGILNLLSWPMMMLSGVWFSMENTNAIAQGVSQIFPLTHMVDAARKIMLDGAGLLDVLPELSVLAGFTVVLTLISAKMFRWD
ncbi:MAG: ABC transporter permease [bacterium]